MSRPPQIKVSKADRAAAAVKLAQLGDLQAARAAFVEAIESDPRNVELLFNLGIVEEGLGDVDQAAILLTRVLASRPSMTPAAARLSRLFARFEVADVDRLDRRGLRAALQSEGIGRQPIAEVALRLALANPLKCPASACAEVTPGSRDPLQLTTANGHDPAPDYELLHLALRHGIVKHAAAERYLTKVRAELLDAGANALLDDRQLLSLALSLVVQGWHNDHAWAVSDAEARMLDALPVDREALLAGDRAATAAFVLTCLYRPLHAAVTPPLAIADAQRLKPHAVRDIFAAQVSEHARQTMRATAVPSLRPLADATTRRVSSQYEAAPYPRWTSLHVSQPGSLKRSLGGFFPATELAFMDAPFDVLVAGCGTGQQALQSAAAYGPEARMLALDISRSSLGYAADMAQRNGIASVEFLHGDILDAGLIDRDFDIIECVGVLHHMADWRAGWRALLDRLKPHGLMYVGLYSATARRELAALRDDPAYPGAGCSDDTARAYRTALTARAAGEPGATLTSSRDFYALNAFRDLVLHESETHVSLEEIASFLDDNGLAFAGFTVEPSVRENFAAAFPAGPPHGSLADWAAFERGNQHTFDAMYRFWLSRRR